MKDHIYWQVQLNSFIDHELGPADYTALEEHLSECADCSAQAEFLQSMKKRLKAHREMVKMPEAVKQRVLARLGNNPWTRRYAPVLSMAASLLIFGLLVLTQMGQSLTLQLWKVLPGREVVTANLSGTIVCPDCMVAEEIGCEHGSFCQNGCVPGILDKDGALWRIARDDKGLEFGKYFDGLYGQQVVLSGDLIFSAHMVRLDSVKTLNDTMIGALMSEPEETLARNVTFSNNEKLLARVF